VFLLFALLAFCFIAEVLLRQRDQDGISPSRLRVCRVPVLSQHLPRVARLSVNAPLDSYGYCSSTHRLHDNVEQSTKPHHILSSQWGSASPVQPAALQQHMMDDPAKNRLGKTRERDA